MEEAQDTPTFKLSAELKGHEGDVRAVCAYDFVDGGVATGSRDNTVKIWVPKKDSSPVEYECTKTLVGHSNYVSCLAYMGPSAEYPLGTVISGSHDKNLLVWDVEEGNPRAALTGHQGPVSCVSIAPTGEVVSGSWDNTARIWHGEVATTELKGHTQNLLAVLALGDNEVITASGDRSIKRWRDGKQIRTIATLSDIPRGMAIVEGIGFVYCSNDGEVRLSTLDGTVIQTLSGHTHMVYSVAVLPTGEIVSAGEDKSVKIWRDGECVQTIPHPGTVWDVKVLSNGDIVTGCSDKIGRIFTRATERVGSELLIKEYEENLASQQVSSRMVGQVDTQKLPGEEALNEPGINDGQTKLIRQAAGAAVFQWSKAERKWIKIGDVVEGPGQKDKTFLEGKLYDYVFDIELEGPSGGVVTRKIGMNKGDNPYKVAQSFVWKHDLRQDYLDQIAEFLITNSESTAVIGEQAPSYSDPLTGGNRYTPGGPSASGGRFGGDPFTGSGRYTPSYGSESRGMGTGQQGGAPAVSAYAREALARQQSGVQPESAPVGKHFPKAVLATFKQANFAGIQKKVNEFNGQLKAEGSQYALIPEEEEQFGELIGALQQGNFEETVLNTAQFEVINKLLQWPSNIVFPALDLIRLVILTPSGQEYYSSCSFNVLDAVIAAAFGPSGTDPVKILGLRFVANSLTGVFKYAVLENINTLLFRLQGMTSASDKVRPVFASALLNLSVALSETEQEDGKKTFISTLQSVVMLETDNSCLYTELVALGNVLYNSPSSVSYAKTVEIKEIVESRNQRVLGENVAECAAAILRLLK